MSDTMIATIFTEAMAKLEEAIQDGRSKEELLGLIADAREKFKSNPKPKPEDQLTDEAVHNKLKEAITPKPP